MHPTRFIVTVVETPTDTFRLRVDHNTGEGFLFAVMFARLQPQRRPMFSRRFGVQILQNRTNPFIKFRQVIDWIRPEFEGCV